MLASWTEQWGRDAEGRGRWTMSQLEQETQTQKTNITKGNRVGLSGRKNTASSFWSNLFNSTDGETRSPGNKVAGSETGQPLSSLM